MTGFSSTVGHYRPVLSALIVMTFASSAASSYNAPHNLWSRDATSTSKAKTPTSSSSGAGAGAGAGAGSLQTGNNPPIVQSMAPSTMTALPATFTPGSPSPISGAPALPSTTLNIASYPPLDLVPSVNSPEVKEWLSQIDMTKIPSSAPTGLNGCSNASNAAAVKSAGANGNCWWTCGGCSRDTDITVCPNKATWGASFDDGPSPDTPILLDYLAKHNLTTTFFVVGSRVLSRPAMLQYEYEAGNQISVHTWSHPALTTLTNEQIVAELGWSKKVIKDVLGVTPNTMRPPYGDIDDRVRYIAMAMGLTPIIWTTSPAGKTFDTQDWKISTGIVTPAQVLKNFQDIIASASSLTTGFIVLAHDLYPQSVALAVEYVLPQALAAGNLTVEPIITCLGQPLSEGYAETATTNVSTTFSTNSSTPSSNVFRNGTDASGFSGNSHKPSSSSILSVQPLMFGLSTSLVLFFITML